MRVALTNVSYISCNVYGITQYMKHRRFSRRHENSIIPIEYPLAQLLHECAT